MTHIVKLNRTELLCAIEDYLAKKGYKPSKKSYYPCVTFQWGKIEIGTQREPESIETVVSVECVLED
jgi:hypothetical protein